MVLILKGIILYGNSYNSNNDDIDKNLLKNLASFYGSAVSGDTTEFESCLVEYFRIHYKDIVKDDGHSFLYKFTNLSEENQNNLEEGDLFKIARQFEIEPTTFENHFGSNLVVKDGLIYENNSNGLNVIYTTNNAITNTIDNLYGSSLYYNHLAQENASLANSYSNLQNELIDYANSNGIEFDNGLKGTNNPLSQKRRFIKRKTFSNKDNNIINFNQESC